MDKINYDVQELEIDKLIPFKNHPFKLYEGQRFQDMVDSIKTNGILMPIIVRPIKDTDTYEILSGYNRVEATKKTDLKAVPVIVKNGLTDEEAMVIVTETNLIQRSFADLSHSERAYVLVAHHEATKQQGKRNDLIKEISELLKEQENSKVKINETSSPLEMKLDKEKYNMSRANIARYIRIDKLIDDLKKRVDDDEIAIRSAVELSFLSQVSQRVLETILKANKSYKVDISKATKLRELQKNKKHGLTENEIVEIFSNNSDSKMKSIRINQSTYLRYFKDKKVEDIEKIISEALERYFQSQDNSETDNDETTE